MYAPSHAITLNYQFISQSCAPPAQRIRAVSPTNKLDRYLSRRSGEMKVRARPVPAERARAAPDPANWSRRTICPVVGPGRAVVYGPLEDRGL